MISKNRSIHLDIISKYRTELMGIAMLNVLVMHSLSWTHLENPHGVILLLKTFGRLMFTEGFLFLSGFGLYYSFHKDGHIRRFFVKRIKRLFIPYIIISIPFLLYHFAMGDFGIELLLLKLSTVYFWLFGNDGMWYISVSVLLYLLYPLLHRALSWRGVILLFLMVYLFIAFVFYFDNDYYQKIKIGIEKIPFFVLGMYVGKLANQKCSISLYWFLAVVIVLGGSYVVPSLEWLQVKESSFRLMGIILCILSLARLDKSEKLMGLLRLFGKYSLEIYILHMMLAGVLLKLDINSFVATFLIMVMSLLLSFPAKKFSSFFISLIRIE